MKTGVAASVVALVLVGGAHSARVAPCRTADLHIWVTHTGAALGTVGGYLAFTNRSQAACTMTGWTTLTAFRPGAARNAIHVRQTMFGPDQFIRGVPREVRGVPTVMLRHGRTAVAAFAAGDNSARPDGACPPPYQRLRVTPPGNATSAVVSAWLAGYAHNLPDCTAIYLSMAVPASGMPRR